MIEALASEVADMGEKVQTSITLTAEQIQFLFQSFQDNNELWSRYIRFIAGAIELGRTDSETTVHIDNEQFQILQNGISSLYLRGGRVYAQELQVKNYVYFDNWAQFPMQNGGLAIAWIGG